MDRLKNQLIIIFALATVIAFSVSWIMLSNVLKRSIIQESTHEITTQTLSLGEFVKQNGLDSLEHDLDTWKGIIGGRITAIAPDGKVILDSEVDPSKLDNHADRPEIRQAFESGEGSALRYSRSINRDLLYVAHITTVDGGPLVIRVAYPLETLHVAFIQARHRLLAYVIIVLTLVILLAFWAVRRFFRPLEKIIDVACRISNGEEGHFPLMKNRELQKLSNALDTMSTSLRTAMEELHKDRNVLHRIVTSMPIGVILLDEALKVRYFNQVALALLQISFRVEEGVYVERILPYADMFSLIDKVKQGPESSIYLQIPEKDKKYLRIDAIPTGAGILMVVTDLSDERRLEEARRHFVIDASHELQTPLTTIRVTAEYLLDEIGEDPEKARYLKSIILQQERMTKLVDDLLLLSKMEFGPDPKKKEECELDLLVSALVDEASGTNYAENISFTSYFEEHALVSCRIEELTRAISNVIDNAVKYVREKFGNERGGKIDITLSRKEPFWILVVSDNGVGITEESAPKIFERFQRGDSHRARGEWGKGGYGLGLAIAKRIFEGHGGSIELLSGSGGATFEIQMPILKKEEKHESEE
ncbi:MAG: hypothetical protein JW971_08835 [Synergistales bacterium]|nr:hypothetical protein [Synergistales bacterium]